MHPRRLSSPSSSPHAMVVVRTTGSVRVPLLMDSAASARGSKDASALISQFSDLFQQIASSTRSQRTDEACDELNELLLKHSREICDSRATQQHLFDSIVRLAAAGARWDTALRVFSIVQDAAIMPPHAKREQLAATCARLLDHVTSEAMCESLIAVVLSLLNESSLAVPNLITRIFDAANHMFRQGASCARAVALQVIASLVVNYPTQLKSMKHITDALRLMSGPSYLVRETLHAEESWFQRWASHLFVELIRHGVFEIKTENAEVLVRELESHLSGSAAESNETYLRGILTLVSDFATLRLLAQAFSWNPKKWRQCLFDTAWEAQSSETQRLAIRATVGITQVRISDIVDDARVALCKHLVLEPAAAASALRELMRANEPSAACLDEVTKALSDCLRAPLLTQSSDESPSADTTAREASRQQIAARSHDEPSRVSTEVLHLVSYVLSTGRTEPFWEAALAALRDGRYHCGCSLLEVMPAELVSERREMIADVIPSWADLAATSMEACARLAAVLHQTTLIPTMLSALHADQLVVRRAAATALTKIAERIVLASTGGGGGGGIAGEHARSLDTTVTNVVEQLLDAAVTDSSTEFRYSLLASLTSVFDAYLSLPDHLEAVFMTRFDAHVDTQRVSLSILCRVLKSHPAFVHSPLVRYQEYALKELELRDSTVAEASVAAMVLRTCAEGRGLLVQPKQVELVVLDRLSKNPYGSIRLSVCLMQLLRAVLDNSGVQNHLDASLFVNTLAPVMVEGPTAIIRTHALDTLASVVRTIGIPLDSALFYEVYNTCANLVVNDTKEDDEPRKSAVYVLSVLGAVNPVKIRSVTRHMSSGVGDSGTASAASATSTASATTTTAAGALEDSSQDQLLQHKPHPRSHPHIAERYPSIVLYFLLKTMQGATDSKLQQDALRCAYDTLQGSPANQKSSLMAQLVPQLRRWLAEPDKANLYEFILKILADLSALLRQFKDTLPSQLGTDILKSLQVFCQQPRAAQKPLNALVVELLDELARGLPVQDIREHRWAVEFVQQRLSRDKDDVALILRVVKALEAFSTFLHEKDMRQLLPHVLECLDVPPAERPTAADASSSAPAALQQVVTLTVAARQVNAACFDFLTMIVQRHPALVKDMCGQMAHSLMQFVEEATEEEDKTAAVNCLAGLISAVGRPAQRFIVPVQKLCVRKGLPADTLPQLLQTIANGIQKVKLPAPKHEDALLPDLPISVISHMPTLSKEEFEQEITTALKIDAKDIEVLGVSHPGGQTVVHFRFTLPDVAAEAKVALFQKKSSDTQSSLRRSLGIVGVEQRKQRSFRVSAELLTQLSSLPETKVRRKREFTWLNWVQSVCVSMLRGSPNQPFRVLGTLTPINMWLVQEVFPFAVAAVLAQLDVPQRASIMQLFSQTIQKAPNDIRLLLFHVAEFMESERCEKKPQLVKVTKTVTCTVERESAEQKFGINYDQDARGIIVTKLAPDGPGSRAGVPVQGLLLSINGQKVRSVNEIPSMIRGLAKIQLSFSVTEEVRQTQETKPLMDVADVARAALESEFHAKAIYFSEVHLDQLLRALSEGMSRTDAEAKKILQVVEGLMKCYNSLGMSVEAKGVAKLIARKFTDNIIAPERFGFDEAGTLEQMHWWSDALHLYRSRLEGADADAAHLPSLLGMLRCLSAMGQPRAMLETLNEKWPTMDPETRAAVSPLMAKAALNMGAWEAFDASAAVKPEQLDMVERCVYLFRGGARDALLKYIKEERDARFEAFCESLDDSYMRCYDIFVELQHLAHFEEVLQYKHCPANDERRALLRGLWRKRALQAAKTPEIWSTIVHINSLVLTEEEDLVNRVDCVNVCSKQGWTSYAEDLLEKLLGDVSALSTAQLLSKEPTVIRAYLRHLYNTNRKMDALRTMDEVLASVKVSPSDAHAEAWGRCWLLLGEWRVQLSAGDVAIATEALKKATELCPRSASAFHSLGILHYEQSRDTNQASENRTLHCVAALNALITAVQLANAGEGSSSVLQDMLRILALWFAHKGVAVVNETVSSGALQIPDHLWLRVIPQLIARMGINSRRAREILGELLIRVGSRYPHAFIYPLTVSERSTELIRRKMAENVLLGIRQSCDQLVKEASNISNELVRMAILWAEKWQAQIQAAASKPDDPAEILRILQPLYDELEHPSTPNERNFEKSYGLTLRRAKTALTSKAMDQAWQLLKQVFGSIGKSLAERKLQMSDVSPMLDSVHKSIVAVPGTFDPSKPLVLIQRLQPKIIVMPSKQKPRRFGMEGSDGNTYRFLLKGHEDLRQDERVMQFLDLINSIFAGDATSTTLELSTPRYAVIPLTDNVGLIGWVESTETIYRMLETRRHEYNLSVYEEVNLIVQKAGLKHIDEYHRLPKAERKALLSFAMQNTPQDELARIIWDKNETCEQWLEYRRLYAHTLAIMSMVGYVLGLGDRHLNNLMLQQGGAVVHIDFGDCFEVAMHRALYTEMVPFRLTRILVAALGVTGVDGVFRHTCEHVMKLLRRHRENLLSILEAFIYDPLINWKLTAAVPAGGGGGAAKNPGEQPVPGATTTTTATATMTGEGGKRESRESSHVSAEAPGAEDESGIPVVLAGAIDPNAAKVPALSCTVRKASIAVNRSVASDYDGDQELRNQQAHVAVLRVHAKLSGQDFLKPSATAASTVGQPGAPYLVPTALSSGETSVSDFFSESVKDSVAGPYLAAYLQQMQSTSLDVEVLDVPQQVERLIQEATSLDNLAEAYITGWAPFW